jgi:hypothetical protein
LEVKKTVGALKDAMVRSEKRNAKKPKVTQDQLGIEKATKTEAEKKVRQAVADQLAWQVAMKKQKTRLLDVNKTIGTLKDALVRSDNKNAKKLKFTQDQLGVERATKIEAEKNLRETKIEAERKLRQALAGQEKARIAADKAVRHKCKAITVKNNTKIKLKKKNETLKELKADTQGLLMDAKLALRTKESGHPCTCQMERHARSLMAIGISANTAREQFMQDAAFFLSPEQFRPLEFPDARWHQRQREATGMESWLHAHLKLAKCNTVCQFGFDETEIQGVATMNQWVYIETDGEREMVTLEAGGMLCGSTVREAAFLLP